MRLPPPVVLPATAACHCCCCLPLPLLLPQEDHGYHHADRPGGGVGGIHGRGWDHGVMCWACGCGSAGAGARVLMAGGAAALPLRVYTQLPEGRAKATQAAHTCLSWATPWDLLLLLLQDYYPELMWKCLIINAPTSFRWGGSRPWGSSRLGWGELMPAGHPPGMRWLAGARSWEQPVLGVCCSHRWRAPHPTTPP